jgi:hypothetical protein
MVAFVLTTPSQPAQGAPGRSLGSRRAAPRREQAERPTIKLDHLTFPAIPRGSYYKSHLRRSLQRETYLADWGAGADAVIEYRYRVDTLRIEREGGLVRVHCAATGELPRGKNATSRLTFSGEAAKERRLVEQVLSIVARGVVTRLAQIEHRRRQAAGI